MLLLVALLLGALLGGSIWMSGGLAGGADSGSPAGAAGLAELVAGPPGAPGASGPANAAGRELRTDESGSTRPGGAGSTRVALTSQGEGEREQRTFTGRVFRADATETPVAGVEVRLLQERRDPVVGTSAADGTFDLTCSAHPEARLELAHPAYVDRRFARIDPAQPFECGLVPSGRISGRVTNGPPGPPAALEVFLLDEIALRDGRAERERRPLGEDGSFVFEDLRPAYYAVAVTGEGVGLRMETGIRVVAGETTDVDLSRAATGRLEGSIRLRGAGGPIEGAQVSVVPDLAGVHEGVDDLAGRSTTSAADGRFLFDGLTPGPHRVEVVTPWSASREERVVVPSAGVVERNLELAPPAELRGVVVTQDGSPVAGATVLLGLRDTTELDWASARTAGEGLTSESGADGGFRFPRVPSGERLFLCAVEDHGSSAGLVRSLELREGQLREGVEIVLAPTLAVAGRVVDEAGVGLRDVTVGLTIRSVGAWSEWERRATDGEGHFAFDRVPGPTVRLLLEREGFLRQRVAVEDDGASERLELVLERASVLAGWVVDENGAAIEGARVVVRADGSDKRRGTYSDAFGEFRLELAEGGACWLEAGASGFARTRPRRVSVAAGGETLTVVELESEPLPEPGIVTGELALIRTGEPVPDLTFHGTRGGTPQLDGNHFRVTGVRPGRVRLVVGAPRVESLGLPALELAPGAEVDLGRFELRRASEVQVTVRSKDGRLVQGAEVRLELLSPDQGGLGRGPRKIALEEPRNGRFEHDAIPRFQWRLRVTHPRHAAHVQLVKIRKARERIEVTLQRKP